MANPNAPFGLRPVRHLFGGVIRDNRYDIADQYATGLYIGDPVVVTGTNKSISIATAGGSNKITGVFNGCEYIDANGDTKFAKFWPAGQVTKNAVGAKALVIDDPHVVFEVMFAALAAANMRKLASLVSGAGNNFSGQSGWTAAQPVGGETQLKIYALSGGANPGGIANALGNFAVAEVLLAQHELAGNMVGI